MNNIDPIAIANNSGAQFSLREIRDCGISMGMYYQSQRSIGAGNSPDRRLGGIEDEANCKRLTKWRNITLAVLQCTIHATNIKSKLKMYA